MAPPPLHRRPHPHAGGTSSVRSHAGPRPSPRAVPHGHPVSATRLDRPPAVASVRWPEEVERLEALRARGEPRLILVGPDTAAPPITSHLEDWMRLPGGPGEVDARRVTLAARAAAHVSQLPQLDDAGLLHFRGRWVALSVTDRGLADAFVHRFGAVVPAPTLAAAVVPEPSRGTLRVQVARLRTRLEPLGLEVRAVRARGYLLRAATQRPSVPIRVRCDQTAIPVGV